MESVVPVELIERKILLIRGQKVMLDSDLAELYGVASKRLNEQVRRNSGRFPEDFVFQLTVEEISALRSQFATLKKGRGRHRKYAPYVFTEHGALMAASVLNSEKAVETSLFVIRAFVRLREMISSHKTLAKKLDELETKLEGHETSITEIVKVIQYLTQPEGPLKKNKIGFIHDSAQ
jgi:hypothetical protein